MSVVAPSPLFMEKEQLLMGAEVPSIPPKMKVEIWDDDSLFDAHEGAAADLWEEHVRTEEEQAARDEIASKAMGIITSAAESPFSDAGKKMQLINNLVASLGALCDHTHLSELLDKHFNSHEHHHEASEHDAEADDEENLAAKKEKTPRLSIFSIAKGAGSLMVQPLFPGLRKLLKLKA